MGYQQTLLKNTCNDTVTLSFWNGESFYQKLFAIKDCRLTFGPSCIHIYLSRIKINDSLETHREKRIELCKIFTIKKVIVHMCEGN